VICSAQAQGSPFLENAWWCRAWETSMLASCSRMFGFAPSGSAPVVARMYCRVGGGEHVTFHISHSTFLSSNIARSVDLSPALHRTLSHFLKLTCTEPSAKQTHSWMRGTTNAERALEGIQPLPRRLSLPVAAARLLRGNRVRSSRGISSIEGRSAR
jgi:hypothetical protein